MVHILALVSAALTAVAAVSGYVVPRTDPPQGWVAPIMENYDVYHTRYVALGCQTKHNTDFFTACCHPMKANETLATARAPYCNPANTASTSSSAPAPVETGSDDDDDDDCDGEGEGDQDQGAGSGSDGEPATSSTPAPSVAPVTTPAPSPPPSTEPPKPTSTEKPAPKSVTPPAPKSVTPPPASTSAAPSPPPSSSGQNWVTGGEATFFDQGGAAGSCGNVNPDTAKIVAVQAQRMEPSLCGKQVLITNTANGKSVTATIQDTCPGCQGNRNSLDLSHGAFDAIGDEATGVLPIKWVML